MIVRNNISCHKQLTQTSCYPEFTTKSNSMVERVCMCVSLHAQSCQIRCDPIHCSLTDFSVHGILQARTLEWVALSTSRRSSRPRDQTWVSYIACRFLTTWATREVANPGHNLRSSELNLSIPLLWAFQVALVVKNSPASVGGARTRVWSWGGKVPWRRWQLTPVKNTGKKPGKFHG